MKLKVLYNVVRQQWPETIDISDGRLCEDNGFLSWNLVSKYDEINEKVGIKTPWLEVGYWAFHQSLWQHARENFKHDKHLINPSDVCIKTFDENLRENLDDSSWDTEREIYLEMNGS